MPVRSILEGQVFVVSPEMSLPFLFALEEDWTNLLEMGY